MALCLIDEVQMFRKIIGQKPSNEATKATEAKEKVIFCSFCGKSQHEVKKIIAGPSVFICDECIELSNDIVMDILDARITRSISFKPEHAQAGIGILANFSKVIKQKYPDIPVTISIKQNGLKVDMVITTPTGDIETITEALDQYGLVVKGEMSPSDFLADPMQVLELKNKLEMSALELRLTKELHWN
jgi:hypothetical protein